MQSIISTIFHFFKELQLMGAFLSMFIENIGIPLPTEIGYLIGQDLLYKHRYSYEFIIFILTLGHVLGSLVSYRIGMLGDSYITKKLKTNTKIHEVQDKLKIWYKKYGTLTIFFTRFVGYVRPWSSYVAGFAEVPFWPFLLWTTIGSLIFNIIAVYFSGIFLMIWRNYAGYHTIFAILMCISFFGFLIYEAINIFVVKKKDKNNG